MRPGAEKPIADSELTAAEISALTGDSHRLGDRGLARTAPIES